LAGALLRGLALFATWALLEIIVIAVSLSAASLNLTVFGATVNVILHLGFLVVFSGLLLGMNRIALDIVEGGHTSWSLLTHSKADGPAYLLALTLYWTTVAAGMLMLMFVPGVFVAVRHAFFRHVLPASRYLLWRLGAKPLAGRESLHHFCT
jgi:hypothetical protein